MLKTLSWFLAAVAVIWAQPAGQKPQQRDLKYETGAEAAKPAKPPASVVIPRSYALVVGIAKYQNLSDKDQLQFSERDAEAIYSILISPEGGNFHAENVHRLIGQRATLANLRRELEQWLPTAAGEGD